MLLHTVFSLYIQKTVLHNTPVSGDESSMVFQGQLFANGELFHKNSCSQAEGIFKRHHVVLTDKKEYSKYLIFDRVFSLIIFLFLV
jgi:hypothetical protein